MAYPNDFTLPADVLEELSAEGLEYLPELIRVIMNTAMKAERQKYLRAAPYERSAERQDQANGFKSKTVKTRMGEIEFAIPQVRRGDFYPQALEKGLRSERALTTPALHQTQCGASVALAEMYVQGTSTRKVNAIVVSLCGTEVSSQLVSKATAELDPHLESWRKRPLGEMRYLFLDARYEKVRRDGQAVDVAVLIAQGIDAAGKRRLLGVRLGQGEAEVFWRALLESLVQRGLCGARLIVSDSHAGLAQARKAVFGGIPWQRCQFHLQQNAQAYVPRREMWQPTFAESSTPPIYPRRKPA
jgi:putative transposase